MFNIGMFLGFAAISATEISFQSYGQAVFFGFMALWCLLDAVRTD